MTTLVNTYFPSIRQWIEVNGDGEDGFVGTLFCSNHVDFVGCGA
jgi:hypothetical protein